MDSLREIKTLTIQRERALELRAAANTGVGQLTCKIVLAGRVLKAVGDPMSETYLRQALIEGCTDTIIAVEARLIALGVHVHPAEPEALASAEGWKRQAGMYQMAWSRELGPRNRKAHFIDELVVGTRELRAAAVDVKPAFGYAAESEPLRALADYKSGGVGYLAIDTNLPGGVRRLDPETVSIKFLAQRTNEHD